MCLERESLNCFALMEKKLKGKGEVSWCGVNSNIAGVQVMKRARKGVAQSGDRFWMCSL